METVRWVRHAYEDNGQAVCQEKQSAKRSLLMEFPKSWSYILTVVIVCHLQQEGGLKYQTRTG